MLESAQDLIAVLVGLIVLWFLFGGLVNQTCLWGEHRGAQRKRQRLVGSSRGGRSSSR